MTETLRKLCIVQQMLRFGTVARLEHERRKRIARSKREPLPHVQTNPVRVDALEGFHIRSYDIHTMRVGIHQEKELRCVRETGPALQQRARRLVGVPFAGDQCARRIHSVPRAQIEEPDRAQCLIHSMLLNHQDPCRRAREVRNPRRIRNESLGERHRRVCVPLYASPNEPVGRGTDAQSGARQTQRQTRACHHSIHGALRPEELRISVVYIPVSDIDVPLRQHCTGTECGMHVGQHT